MKNKPSLIIASCLLVVCLTGCVAYRHSRSVDGEKKKESTYLGTIFKKGEASLVQSQTIDSSTGYSRTIGAQQIKSEVDAKGIKATGEGVVNGLKTP